MRHCMEAACGGAGIKVLYWGEGVPGDEVEESGSNIVLYFFLSISFFKI